MDATMKFNGVRIKTPPKFGTAKNGQEYCQFITCFREKSVMLFFFDDERADSPFKRMKADMKRAEDLDQMPLKEALTKIADFRKNSADALFVGETKVNLECAVSVYDAGKLLKENKEQLDFRFKVQDFEYADTYGTRQTLLSLRAKEKNTAGEKKQVEVKRSSNALSDFGI